MYIKDIRKQKRSAHKYRWLNADGREDVDMKLAKLQRKAEEVKLV